MEHPSASGAVLLRLDIGRAIILPHFSVSSAMNFSKSEGKPTKAEEPRSASRAESAGLIQLR